LRTSEGGSAGVFACGFAERPRPVFLRAARRGPNPQPGRLRYAAVRPGLTRGSGCCHVVAVMSITVQLDLPEALAAKARARGLLSPAHLTQLITRELAEDEDSRDFFQMARDIRSLPGEPMSMSEIQQIVDEVRTERAAREAGH